MRNLSLALALLAIAARPLAAAEVQLSAVQFPEGSSVDVKLLPTTRVSLPPRPRPRSSSRTARPRVEVDYKKLPPAILFGGDVTSYVCGRWPGTATRRTSAS